MSQSPVRLPFNYAKRHGAFIAALEKNSAHVCYQSGASSVIFSELRRVLKRPLQLSLLTDEEFSQRLAQAYESGTEMAMEAITGLEEDMDLAALMQAMPATKDLLESEDDAPIIRLINAILTQAIKQKASDVHVEIFEDKVVVRLRVDGVLREILQPPRVLAPLITSRLKILSKLDIAEKRLPQDGRIALKIAGRSVDVRVSTIPTHYGERIVLRLLDKQSAPLDLSRLGMAPDTLALMRRLVAKPHGIFLVTGPTGSGKTTSLYAALTEINDATRNILTVEDPIEYYLAGIGQTQVNTKVDMTFARGLRAILRQDPDVVMVGEIRDLETVDMAIQASLTGHLVLSTLHTNSAIGAITRLRDMGAEPFLLSSTVIGVAAQRLVRVLCSACRKADSPTPAEREKMDVSPDEKVSVYRAVGCDECNQLGFRGRTGLYELIDVDDELRAKIHDSVKESEMEAYARQTHPSMRQDGWRRVLAGETTIEEVLRVTAED